MKRHNRWKRSVELTSLLKFQPSHLTMPMKPNNPAIVWSRSLGIHIQVQLVTCICHQQKVTQYKTIQNRIKCLHTCAFVVLILCSKVTCSAPVVPVHIIPQVTKLLAILVVSTDIRVHFCTVAENLVMFFGGQANALKRKAKLKKCKDYKLSSLLLQTLTVHWVVFIQPWICALGTH